MKAVAIVVAIVAALVTVAICWHWNLGLLGSEHGIHGGYGFEIFVGVFAAIYVPIALVRRARQRRQAGNGNPGDGS